MNSDASIENGMIVQGEPADTPFEYTPDFICESCDATHKMEFTVSEGRFCRACMERAYKDIRAMVVKEAQGHMCMIDPAVIAILDFVAEELNIKEEA